MAEDLWCVAVEGSQLEGQYNSSQILKLSGQHGSDHVLVWKPGLEQWHHPDEIPELALAQPPIVDAPAAIHKRKPLKWVLAILLLFGFAECFSYGLKWMEPWLRGREFLTAAANGDVAQIKKSLSEGVSVNVADSNGQTALMMAVNAGKLEAVQTLVDAGAYINVTDETFATALKQAIMRGDNKIAILLVQHKSILLDEKNRSLLFYTKMDDPDLVGAFLKAGLDPNTKDTDGKSLLYAAVASGNPSVVKKLTDLGADPNMKILNGDTPEHLAQIKRLTQIQQIFNTNMQEEPPPGVALTDNGKPDQKMPPPLADAPGHTKDAPKSTQTH